MVIRWGISLRLETIPETGVKYDKEKHVFSICANKGKPNKAAISKSVSYCTLPTFLIRFNSFLLFTLSDVK